jgi:DNA recombination protein RmuC
MATQKSYDAAHNKLISGKGNLVGRAENIRVLGAKASKKLAPKLTDGSDDDMRIEEISSEDVKEIEGADM